MAAVFILLAAGSAIIATLLASLAEHGTPIRIENDGETYRALIRTTASRAHTQVRWSRRLVVLALTLIFAATGVVWLTVLTGEEVEASQDALVLTADGAKCGRLIEMDGTVGLRIGERGAEAIPVDASVILVSRCP